MVRLELLFGFVSLCLMVFCLVEVIRTPEEDIRHLPKSMWLLMVLFFPLVGSVAWLAAGRPQYATRRPGANERNAPGFPQYDRRGRAAASNPDDDEDFLRQVRARAEEQRRRHEEERRKQEGGGQPGPAPEPPADEA
ncbi:MAG TPA: PLD nuclease N-terminal domain-containing protein [Sporichthya sp.]|nr:PLD nuclease N-terminal domain-containing protein [Sporichthya sp.]